MSMLKLNPLAMSLGRRFRGIAASMKGAYPNLKLELDQIEAGIKPEDYIAYSIANSLVSFLSIFLPLMAVLKFTVGIETRTVAIVFTVCLALVYMSFFYAMLYPRMLINRKVRNIDKDLLFALRHLLVKVRSGVGLFDGMRGIARGNYGEVSSEFHKIVVEISSGKRESEVLEAAAYKNPSQYFRRAIWQIASSMKAGADVSSTLSVVVANLSQDQRILIRKYGAELNPFALVYMMTTVIMPTLGITFLIILSSFTGIPISNEIFIVIFFLLCIFQYMFMGMIKTRRPAVEI